MKKLSQQQWANVLKLVVIVGWLFMMNALTSCGSACARTHRYWNTHRCVQVTNDTLPNYFYHNNQIVMVYKNS